MTDIAATDGRAAAVNTRVEPTAPAGAMRRIAGARPPIHEAAAAGGGAAWWMAVSFCAALAVAAAVLAAFGTGKDGIQDGLRATARLAFVPFWLAYAGGALVTLFGPTFQPLKRYGRELGLAFATVLFVHLGLVAWLCLAGATPGVRTFEVFGAAAVCTYLLALFSINRLSRLPGPRGWWLLRTVGMTYIALAFLDDFLHGPVLHGGIGQVAFYLPFVVLAIAGPALRLAALARRRVRP